MSNNVKNPCKVITGKHTVMSYLNVNEPKTPLGGGTPKYSVSLIIPKSDTVTVEKIRAAIKAAYEEGQSKLKGSSKSVPIRMRISSTPTAPASPASSTRTSSRSSTPRSSTPASSAGRRSTSTPTTRTATAASRVA